MNNQRQYKIFYGSSYDRGLERLLDMWKDIKEAVPQAELHIFYGWNLFDAAHNRIQYNPERMAWKEVVNQKMKQEGVFHHGRVGQKQLKEEIRKCGIWAYPTNFDEISCITAMNCQILGAIPVTSKHAALKETVKFGELVPGNIDDPKIQKIFIKFLVEWLKDGEKQRTTRKIMCEESVKLFGWDLVAKDWTEEFKKPKIYSEEWAKEIFESLPKELQKEEFRGYKI